MHYIYIQYIIAASTVSDPGQWHSGKQKEAEENFCLILSTIHSCIPATG